MPDSKVINTIKREIPVPGKSLLSQNKLSNAGESFSDIGNSFEKNIQNTISCY